jgi:hypothetical protein
MSFGYPQDAPRDPLDAVDAVPGQLQHEVVTRTTDDGRPYEQCVACETTAHVSRLDPYGRCPARSLPDRSEAGQTSLTESYVRSDGGTDQ